MRNRTLLAMAAAAALACPLPSLAQAPQRYPTALDGRPLSDRHSTEMLAGAAVGALAATPGPVADGFLRALWNTPMSAGEQRYFDGMLYLMSMMHLAGEFRIIGPSPSAP